MENKSEYVVMSQRLGGFLMLQGFVLQRMEVNMNDANKRRHVFIFNDSEALRKTINKYKEYKLLTDGLSK